jgi:hypothetical protein
VKRVAVALNEAENWLGAHRVEAKLWDYKHAIGGVIIDAIRDGGLDAATFATLKKTVEGSTDTIRIADIASEWLIENGHMDKTFPVEEMPRRLAAAIERAVSTEYKPKTVGHLDLRRIRLAYPHLDSRQIDRLRKKLDGWRKLNEDQVIVTEDAGGRPRYSYPAHIVEEFAHEV